MAVVQSNGVMEDRSQLDVGHKALLLEFTMAKMVPLLPTS